MNHIFNRTFAALKYRNYRLWFFGQLASLVGTFMQSSVQGFFAYELTKSTSFLGLLGFVSGLPTCILMLLGGVVADRSSKKRVFMISQTLAMLLALVLSALTFSGVVTTWHLLILSFLLGATVAFEIPARQALIVDLVPLEMLPNAIGLNATMFQLALSIGPSIGGLIYESHGPGWCFILNAVSYAVVLLTMMAMRIDESKLPCRSPEPALRQMADGIKVVFHDPLLRSLLFLCSAISLFGTTPWNLLPAWTVEHLGGNAETNGYLNACRAFGAVCSALLVAYLARNPLRKPLLVFACLLLPFSLLALSLTTNMILVIAVLFANGWSFLLLINTSIAMVQEHVADNVRGRVMSVTSLSLFGMGPICALWGGYLAPHVGIQTVFALSGVLTLVSLLCIYIYGGKKSLDAGSTLFS